LLVKISVYIVLLLKGKKAKSILIESGLESAPDKATWPWAGRFLSTRSVLHYEVRAGCFIALADLSREIDARTVDGMAGSPHACDTMHIH
jgi:hypothetical protein